MNTDPRTIYCYLCNNDLIINNSKSKYMLITEKVILRKINIVISNRSLEEVNHTR